MAEEPPGLLWRLEQFLDGSYRPNLTIPTIADFEGSTIFAGVTGLKLPQPSYEVTSGLTLREVYACIFESSDVEVSDPKAVPMRSKFPWYQVEGAGQLEVIHIEAVLETSSRPYGLQREQALRSLASSLRLIFGWAISIPIFSSHSFIDTKTKRRDARMIAFEKLPPYFVGARPIKFEDLYFIDMVMSASQILQQQDDLAEAFALAESFWWLPSQRAQMTGIWTAIEHLMRPGKKDITKQLARAIRQYIGHDERSAERTFQEVVRLYSARGQAIHNGVEPSGNDVRDSFSILRMILLRIFMDKCRPPDLDKIVPRWVLREHAE